MAKEGVRFGEFWLQRKIGVGGMAEVFLARREGPSGFEKQLVVKRLLPHLNQRPKFTEMFLREARYAALIDHPNFAHVSAFGKADHHYYLAMEYVDGVTIREMLTVLGAVMPGVAARIVIDLLDAVHAVHTATDLDGRPLHLVHRDITPRNVMITASGTVKLLDLGIAVSEDDGAPDRAGTRSYMSPEQARGEALDARSDLYAVGVLLAELLAGVRPKDGAIAAAMRRAPSALGNIIQKLVADERPDRPASAREAREELEQFALSCGREGTRGFLTQTVEGVVKPAVPVTESRADEHTASVVEVSEFGPPRPTKVIRDAAVVDVATADERPTALHQRLEAPGPTARSAAIPSRRGPRMAIVVGVLAVATLAWLGWPSTSVPRRSPSERVADVSVADPIPPPPAMVATATVPVLAPSPAVTETAEAPPVVRRRHRSRRRAKTKTKRRPPKAAAVVEPGFLNVDARPWANVYVDGRRVGQTPLARWEIASGRHDVRLVNDDLGLEATFRITVRPNEIVRVRKRFESPP